MWPNKDARSAFTQQLFRNGKVRNLEQRYITRSNEHRSFLLSSDLITFDNMPCVLSVCRDITEKTIFAAEMARLDRLNLVGEMAASLGHEIRNPLTTVRGYLQVFLRNSQFSQYFKQLTTMIEELDRANSIITEFLSLAKNKTIDLHPDNINNVIIALAPLLQADALRMGHNLLIEFGILPEIVFDEKEIRQLLLNLVRNALEAMSPGGKAIIKTHLDRDWVVLTVEDNGPGISEELFNRLGIPFVTTKPNGFGLGLPVCFRIAQRHDANINIDTSTLGTTFEVRFSTKSAELPLQMGCR
jgi:signal transduction histidine kinase